MLRTLRQQTRVAIALALLAVTATLFAAMPTKRKISTVPPRDGGSQKE